MASNKTFLIVLQALVISFFLLSSCSSYGRSKDCMELAEKVMKKSFEEAPKLETEVVHYLEVFDANRELYELAIDSKGNITKKKTSYQASVIPKPEKDTSTTLVCSSHSRYVYSPTFYLIEDKGKISWKSR